MGGADPRPPKNGGGAGDAGAISGQNSNPQHRRPVNKIPAELRSGRWCVAAKDKSPCSPRTGHHGISINRPRQWASYEKAVARFEAEPGQWLALGRLLDPDDDIACIDLDNVLDPVTGELVDNGAAEILDRFAGCYAEVSPSGTGLHVWFRGEVPRDFSTKAPKGKPKYEVYAGRSGRFVTATGDIWRDGAVTEPPPGAIDWLFETHAPNKPADDGDVGEMPPLLDEAETLRRLRKVTEYLTPEERDALEGVFRPDDDRSDAVWQLMKRLAGLGLDARTRFSIGYWQPGPMAVALRHRRQDEARALEYLWKEHAAKTKEFEVDPFSGFDDVPDDADDEAPPGAPTHGSIQVYRLLDLVNDPRPRPPALVEGLLRAGGRLVTAGPPKSKKTYFVESLFQHMALGQDFLNFHVPQPVSVFFVQAEMPWHETRERARRNALVQEALEADGGELLNANFAVTDQLEMFIFSNSGVKELIETIRAHYPEGPDVIGIDALGDVFDGENESDNAQMLRFLRHRVGKLRNAFPNAAIVLVHHTTKVKNEELDANPFLAVRGAGALRGWYDAGLVLHPERGRDTVKVHFELRCEPPVDPIAIRLHRGRVVCAGDPLTYGAQPVHVPWDVVVELLTEHIEQRGVAFSLREFPLRFGRKDGPLGVSRDALRAALDLELLSGDEARVALVPNPRDTGRRPPELLVPKGCTLVWSDGRYAFAE